MIKLHGFSRQFLNETWFYEKEIVCFLNDDDIFLVFTESLGRFLFELANLLS